MKLRTETMVFDDARLKSIIEQTADHILLEVSEGYGTKTQINQTATSITALISDETTNRTTIIRAKSGGVLTAYQGQVYGVYTNASGSVDIVTLNWSGTVASIASTIASYGSSIRLGLTSSKHTIIDSTSVKIKNSSTVLAEFGSSITLASGGATVTVGSTSGKHTVINSDGLTINDGSTAIAYFKNTCMVGKSTGYITTSGTDVKFYGGGTNRMTIGSSNISFGQNEAGAYLRVSTNDGIEGGYSNGTVSGGDGAGGLDFSNRLESTQRAVLYDNVMVHLQAPNVYTGYVNSDLWYENVRFYNNRSSRPLLKCYGDFSVDGSKSRSVKTESYSDRLLYCYETPTPTFGDIGEGENGSDGVCYIFLDPIFAQTISTAQYQVFLQNYTQGNLVVTERNPNYFKVEGTPNVSFGWEIKAKQNDYDQLRLESEAFSDMDFNATDYAGNAAKYIQELFDERSLS